MSTWQIVKDGEALTGALTYMEALQKRNEYVRGDLDNAREYELAVFMPMRPRASKMSALSEAAEQFKTDFPGCKLSGNGQHVIEGAEYNTDAHNAYENNRGVYVALMCKVCGNEAEYVPASNGKHERYWVLKNS